MTIANSITTIVVNYKTEHLLRQCLTTFRAHFPTVPLIVIDNNSADGSTQYIQGLADATAIINTTNVGHGPALDQGIALVTTPYFFTLDSDCEIKTPEFLGEMLTKLEANPALYAVGWLRYVDRCTGVPLEWHTDSRPPIGDRFIPYLHPYAGLYRLSTYKQLLPFFDHGAPCLNNMRDACDKGIPVENFDLSQGVMHWKAGTRRLFHGHWHPNDNQRPGAWNKDDNFPI